MVRQPARSWRGQTRLSGFASKPATTIRIVSVQSIEFPKIGFLRSFAQTIGDKATGDRKTAISQYVAACRKD
ncbi:hypothetical protein [Burkholderia cepacia]|uniref:hypothetical protein n=1 Tax=Burkholderia cepacia TaxID=292 RepID=UPI000AFD88FD|nr:hypothetical protein [Burkholderia cepacia]